MITKEKIHDYNWPDLYKQEKIFCISTFQRQLFILEKEHCSTAGLQ